ncbi:hypothetical protein FOA52_016283 [Chlamydomonas sp. UWO 241]|nr:hypothetical protein FOA52_016283 [Chlamydomonas sp. UWO 241]
MVDGASACATIGKAFSALSSQLLQAPADMALKASSPCVRGATPAPRMQPARTSPPPQPPQRQLPQGLASMACTVAAAALLLLPQPALAELPPGKRAVSGTELVDILRRDFTENKYLVTGRLTKEVYSDQCHFADARDDFGEIGPNRWAAAVSLLFDGDASRLKLTGDVVLDEGKRTVEFTSWRQVDVFRLPGSPHTKVYTGHTTLTLDPVENIVVDHIETWDVDPSEVTKSIKFFDSSFNPPGFD